MGDAACPSLPGTRVSQELGYLGKTWHFGKTRKPLVFCSSEEFLAAAGGTGGGWAGLEEGAVTSF